MSDTERLRFDPRWVDRASKSAAEALTAQAARRRLVDIGFSFVDSPFGRLLLARTRIGLVRLAYPNERPDDVLDELAERLSPRVLEVPAMLDEERRELEDYFAGTRQAFALRVDFSLLREGFSRRVLEATARVPFGSVTTYREVAAEAGSPRGARAAGNALGSNPIPIVVPCHRVLHSGGGLGGYTGGLDRKVTLLELEGAL